MIVTYQCKSCACLEKKKKKNFFKIGVYIEGREACQQLPNAKILGWEPLFGNHFSFEALACCRCGAQH